MIAGLSIGAMQMRTFRINFSSIAVRNIAGEGEQKSVIAQGVGTTLHLYKELTLKLRLRLYLLKQLGLPSEFEKFSV